MLANLIDRQNDWSLQLFKPLKSRFTGDDLIVMVVKTDNL
jgi:hypothetical protein